MITWVDVLLVVVFATFVAAGAQRKLIGFFVGVGGVLLVRLLLGVGQTNPWLAAALGLVVAAWPAARLLCEPLFGWLADRLGAARTLALGCAAVFAANYAVALLAVAERVAGMARGRRWYVGRPVIVDVTAA